MSSENRTFIAILSLLLVVGLVAFGLVKLYGVSHSSTRTVQFVPSATPMTPAVATHSPGVVYVADFDKSAVPGWSNNKITITPKAPQRKFLGPYREEPVTFTLGGLPPHQLIHLTFELLTYLPWNGDSANYGRDVWDMRVVGGQPLIHTTFSNCGFFDDNNEQCFPDQYPWYPTYPGWTGAASRQSLGYTHSWGKDRTFGIDSTYQFDITFPHTDSTLTLLFKSQIKKHENKPNGLLSFKVEPVDHPASASDDQMKGWWSDLAGDDPVKAYHAVWSMIATADAATKYIQKYLPPRDQSIPININQTDLFEHESFEYSAPDARQFARAIHVLEVINSADSKKQLADIGYNGTPQGAPPTRWDRPRAATQP